MRLRTDWSSRQGRWQGPNLSEPDGFTLHRTRNTFHCAAPHRCVEAARIACRNAAGPIEEVGDAKRQDDEGPLRELKEDRWMTGEQGPLQLGRLGVRVAGQIGIAEPALDRSCLDGLPACRAHLCIVIH